WHGKPYPIEVHYEVPPLPVDWMLVGDIHSHVEGSAYTSITDEDDELHRPGLHIVVGRIHLEPPEFHLEVSVDGARFEIKNLETVVERYHQRRTGEVPQSWLDKVTVKTWSSYKLHAADHDFTPQNSADDEPCPDSRRHSPPPEAAEEDNSHQADNADL